MTNLVGQWKLEKNEKWEEYMKAVGVNFALRKIAMKLTTYEDIKISESGEWIMDLTSTFRNVYLRFKLDEEFDETTADGRPAKSICKIVDGVLIQHQRGPKESDPKSIITRSVLEDGTMLTAKQLTDDSLLPNQLSNAFRDYRKPEQMMFTLQISTYEAVGKDVKCTRTFKRY